MRKIMNEGPEPLEETFNGVCLYRDDIEAIYEIATRCGFSVKVTDSEYEFEDLEELKTHRGPHVIRLGLTLTKFLIESPLPSEISVRIDGPYMVVQSFPLDGEHKPFQEIVEIAKRCKKSRFLYSFLPDFLLGGVTTSVIVGVLIFSINRAGKLNVPSVLYDRALTFIITLIFAFGVIAVALKPLGTVYSGVYLTRRHEVRGFFSRNGDRLVMMLIGSLLTFTAFAVKHVFFE